MLSEYLQLLPDQPGNVGMTIALGCTLVGAFLWVFGTKVSRTQVTLLTVLSGAVVGLRLPAWCNWSISGAGTAVGGAVVLGVCGYVLHRMWVGIGFGGVLALWAAFVTWIRMRGAGDWNWPDIDATTTVWTYLPQVWHQVPPEMARILMFVSGAAMVTGIAVMILWPNLTTALSWSAISVTLFACGGIAAVAFMRPQWLANVPDKTWVQAATLVVMMAIGCAIQWKLAPIPARAPTSPKQKPEKADKL